MRAQEFISESKTASAEAVWNYVKQIHPDEQQGGGFLERLIRQYPNYKLQAVPLASLIIHDQESDDPDEEPEEDPYGRVQVVDPEYAGEVSVHNLDRNPIVIDANGHILDGNHRAWAAAELLGRDTIQAWVPVEQIKEDEQVLDEYSYQNLGIQKALEKKGYQLLGRGNDQMAYLEPGTGYILKIFGTQGGKDFSQDQKMFFKFAKFCMKNKDNPFLPRFYGYESFKFKGKIYLQIRTEQLFQNKKLQDAVYRLGKAVKAEILRGYHEPAWDDWVADIEKDVLKIVKTPERLELLKKTLNELYSTGSKNKYWWDLHDENIMVRKDGTPVINDPWLVAV